MAAKNSTSPPRRARNTGRMNDAIERPRKIEASQPASEIPRPLHFAIEAERSRLMTADAILHCAVLAMDERAKPSAGEPYYQSVINTARDMINTTIGQLDPVSLRAVVEYVKSEESVGVATRVREVAAAYLH